MIHPPERQDSQGDGAGQRALPVAARIGRMLLLLLALALGGCASAPLVPPTPASAAPSARSTVTPAPTSSVTASPQASTGPTATATDAPTPTRPPSTATPTTTPTPPPAEPTPATGEALELELIAALNRHRRESGCPVELRRSPELTASARGHSQDMARNHFFDHRGSDGSDRISRAQAAGYVGAPGTRVRENIGAGPDPQQVVAYWVELDDIHRSQIIDCAYNEVGVGYAQGDGEPYSHYWTANFGVAGVPTS